MRLFVSIVTFNSADYLAALLDSLVSLASNLEIVLVDNASKDNTVNIAKEKAKLFADFKLFELDENIGFCGGHNFSLKRFTESSHDYALLLNPDLVAEPEGIIKLLFSAINVRKENPRVGAFTGLLVRPDQKTIDTTGINYTPCLRHFDRLAEQSINDNDLKSAFVGGISGAFLLMHRDFINDLIVPRLSYSESLYKVYPQLLKSKDERIDFFDEAFFAYREDAEIGLRGRRLGWLFRFEPILVAKHVRQVTHNKRAKLPKEINLLGVKNRFLLQLLHFNPRSDFKCLIRGFMVRNLAVIIGVLFYEHQSIPAFYQVYLLFRRCLSRRNYFNRRSSYRGRIWK